MPQIIKHIINQTEANKRLVYMCNLYPCCGGNTGMNMPPLMVPRGIKVLFYGSNLPNKPRRVHLYSPLTARGSRMLSTKEGFVEILEFTHFARIFKFNRTPEIGKKKEISHEIKVSVVMELV